MPLTPPQYLARGTILVSRFISSDGSDNGAVQATANSRIIGVAQEGNRTAPIPGITAGQAALTGESFRAYGDGECCLVTAGASITAGQVLVSDSNGKAIPIPSHVDVLQFVGARALVSVASGGLCYVQVTLKSERPVAHS